MRYVFSIILLAATVSCSTGVAATPDECRQMRKLGQKTEATKCFQQLAISRDQYLSAEGYWGLGVYEDANVRFRQVIKDQPKNAMYRVRWGRLYLERNQPDDASELFDEALEIDEKNADALLGHALVAAKGFGSKAAEIANEALAINPNLLEARELVARLALEDQELEQAAKLADKAIELSKNAFQAYGVRAAIEVLADRSPDQWLEKIKAINPASGVGYAEVAHHLVLNRRYYEGIDYYRKAIAADAELWSARSQLGVNLMRLGQEEEAYTQLEMAFKNGYQDKQTSNTLILLDSYKNFITYKTDNTILRLHRKEAALLRPYFESELKRAIATFEKKYKIKLPRPVQVEVYPDHEDFAVRTMGMPGLGALGVTFNDVIAMDSPSGRKPGTFHWDSTLWHELSHVFAITATNSRVPRWFTEGVAVHEETAASPDWGDRLTPDMIVAVREKKLLPIAQLDKGFMRPTYPAQVIVSYFQAGRIFDYIVQKWGWDKVLEMMHAFGARRTTPDVMQNILGIAPEEFDKQFLAWLDTKIGKTVSGFADWSKRLPGLAAMAKDKKWDEVIKEGEELSKIFPEYVEHANTYQFMAEAYMAKNDEANAAKQLSEYAKIGGRDPATLKELARLEEKLGRPKEAIAALDKVNLIYPVGDESFHRQLGTLQFDQKNYPAAIREFAAAVESKPIDKATAFYNLARAQFAADMKPEAEASVMSALEAAPGFRPAQRLLLQLEEKVTK
jgi:tetratricopeptide (TPR) repeat protein